MSKELKGIAASNGIAVAPAYLLVQPDLSFSKTTVSDVDAEVKRLQKAIQESTDELTKIKDIATKSLGAEEAQVFEAHIMFLSDPEFTGEMEKKINDDQVNAEEAVKEVEDHYVATFQAMKDNAYMQERAADVQDVSKRLLSHLLNKPLPNPALIDKEVIIVAHDLTPSDTAQLNKKYVKAFVTDVGGRTAHSAIMARSLEIPAVVGTNTITQDVQADQRLVVDGTDGDVVVDPTDAQVDDFNKKQAAFEKQKAEWAKLKDAQSVTADGKKVTIGANIGTPKDVQGAVDNGAEAIGLFRSEFLYMDSSELPSEDDQFKAYKAVTEGMKGKQVVVRTMDIGGDKKLPYLPLPKEMNPFLGYRAIRISLSHQDIFRTQLRALLRASAYGKIAIMFPMIATVQEFQEAKAILEDEKDKLIKAGTKVDENIEVGMMMEIPAAAVLADKLAKYADFFSIGTNDLIQYSMAADRGNDAVSYLYQPDNPSIVRLVKNIINSAHKEGKWVGMCGEAAADPNLVPILVGLGLDEYSMSATSILPVRSEIKTLDSKKMADLANKVVTESETSDQTIQMVKDATK
ncbi:phosphoenolpyruvate-protein phosphotransferase [Lactobacillus selangorensis]|uniref:Phosphoenolpyruvate-protein phosphotransferase n=1 Tax=Lactobacillus selangorensis TaxID=81857 RepID=A0A0R2FPZ9_9LACO|nr:phosphoenolpyruvate--protein phosphotransferase [Lactobacillus selangorensis]KRN28421.1 phosphoenolpyruvate-protein phosphotransferase [Lactobacillus selangorensis]KRN31922.1 phosphoenolpyruvate-protein phosphotransferase [Lactobacillus selangorensis]